METRRGVLLVEGQTRTIDGRDFSVTVGDLEKVVAATNAYMRENELWLFVDHVCRQENKIGKLTAGVYIGDYPEQISGPEKRTGKCVICDSIELLDDGIVQQWKAGIARDLSVSLTSSMEIYEVSVVGISAFRGTQLFSVDTTTKKPRLKITLVL